MICRKESRLLPKGKWDRGDNYITMQAIYCIPHFPATKVGFVHPYMWKFILIFSRENATFRHIYMTSSSLLISLLLIFLKLKCFILSIANSSSNLLFSNLVIRNTDGFSSWYQINIMVKLFMLEVDVSPFLSIPRGSGFHLLWSFVASSLTALNCGSHDR
jgi:hypothetical protein